MSSTAAHRVVTCVAAFLLVAAGVAGLLAWDTEKYRGSDGYLHGPYEPWQVLCLVGVLLAVSAFIGLRSEWLTGAGAASLGGVLGAVVVGFAANGSEGAWQGVFAGILWLIPVLLGVMLVAGSTYALRTRQWRTVRYRRSV